MSKFEDLLVNNGLYNFIEISIDDFYEIEKLLSNSKHNLFKFNCFCTECMDIRTFESVGCIDIRATNTFVPKPGQSIESFKENLYKNYLNKRYSITFRCTLESKHLILFDLLVTNDKIIKIGQYPSFADLSIGDISKYKSALGDKFKEYSKSLGLFSHGIGIGSFVYLRRIIENLVFNKYDEVKNNLEISHDDFLNADFKEKINILKDYLPSTLVENKNAYSIVSKGIHQLSEQECISMYPYIKIGIELILDEVLAEKQRAEKAKIFSTFVADATGELKKK